MRFARSFCHLPESLVLFSLLLTAGPGQLLSGEVRQWTYTAPEGRTVVFPAEFIRVQGVAAILEGKDGKRYQPPLVNLSRDDQQYVEKASPCETSEFVEWTDAFGNTLQVRYSGVAGQMVVMATKDDRSFRIPWPKLNATQQKYVINAQRKAANLKAAAIQAAKQWSPIVASVEVATLNSDAMPNEYKRVDRLVFSPDSKRLLSQDCSYTFVIWNIIDLKRQSQLDLDHTDSSWTYFFDNDGGQIWRFNNSRLTKWDSWSGRRIVNDDREEKRRLLRTIGLSDYGDLRGLRFSFRGKIVAVGAFDSQRGRDEIFLVDAATLQVQEALEGLVEGERIYRLEFSRDNKLLAACCDRSFHVWNLETRQHRVINASGWLGNLIDNGELLGVLSNDGVSCFQTATGQLEYEYDVPDREKSADLRVAISPEGKCVAIAHGSEIYLDNWATGTNIAVLHRHAAPVTSLEFSPDGQYLASGDRLGTINLWKLTDISMGSTVSPTSLRASLDDKHSVLKDTSQRPQVSLSSFPEMKEEGLHPIVDRQSLQGWEGGKGRYGVKNGILVSSFPATPYRGHDGTLYTCREYADFILCFDYRVGPMANSGVLLRAPLVIGEDAYLMGIEVQIVDNAGVPKSQLSSYFNGSLAGVAAAQQGYEKPAGSWNQMEITCLGRQITIRLNGATILDRSLDCFSQETRDGHPGLARTRGRIGILGSYSQGIVEYRNMRVREIAATTSVFE